MRSAARDLGIDIPISEAPATDNTDKKDDKPQNAPAGDVQHTDDTQPAEEVTQDSESSEDIAAKREGEALDNINKEDDESARIELETLEDLVAVEAADSVKEADQLGDVAGSVEAAETLAKVAEVEEALTKEISVEEEQKPADENE
jgi:hypothetical protein